MVQMAGIKPLQGKKTFRDAWVWFLGCCGGWDFWWFGGVGGWGLLLAWVGVLGRTVDGAGEHARKLCNVHAVHTAGDFARRR